ncbi:MAG: hypothetical protein ACLT98_00095 [Eggerthellaceae bacterium]
MLDWRAEADAWHEMGPHYLEPEHPAPPRRPFDSGASGARAEAPAATAAPLPVGGALPPLEIADVAALARPTPRSMRRWSARPASAALRTPHRRGRGRPGACL